MGHPTGVVLRSMGHPPKLILDSTQFFKSREALDEALQKVEISESKEKKFVLAMESLATLVVFMTPRIMKKIEVIALTKPGRPRELSSEQETVLCEYVSKLHAEETDLGICKDRAAQKFDVSRSTVERIWLDRKKKKRGMTFREIWDVFFFP